MRAQQEKINANSQLDSALGRLLVVVENYPQLKSNENFLRLQDELANTENKIAVSRRRDNETVQRYNTNIDLFPNNIAHRYSDSSAMMRTLRRNRLAPDRRSPFNQ